MIRSPLFVEKFRQGLASLFIALGFGAFAFDFLFKHWSGRFSGKTDIIGYPIFANFNNYALLNAYFLSLLICLAILAFIIYTCNGHEWHKLSFFSVFNLLSSVIIGEAIIMKQGHPFFATVAIVYLCQYFLNALILFRSPQNGVKKFRETREAIPFSLILILVPVALYVISKNTGWNEESGQLTRLVWFPKQILIIAELALFYFIFRMWQQNASIYYAQNQAISYVIIPALIFLITAFVHGTFTFGDDFHTGEHLVPLALSLKGELPWRDFLFVHGVWQDFLKSFLGTKLWGPSLRAGLESSGLLFNPSYWILLYLLILKVFKDSFLKALIGLVIGYALVADPFRFPLYSVVLFCLYQAFVSSKKIWFGLFSLCAVVQIFISPEFGLIAFGLGCAIITNDILEFRDDVRKFQRTLVCALTCSAVVTVILLTFNYFDLLDGFLVSIVHFSRSHLDVGGVPIQAVDNLVWVATVPILFIACVAYLMLSRMQLKQRFTPLIYLLFGLAIGVAIYFIKFIGRPDGHIYHVVAVAVPGIALLTVYFLGIGIKQTSRRFPIVMRRIIYLSILLVLMRYGIPGFTSTNWIVMVESNLVNLKSRLKAPSAAVGGGVRFPGIAAPNTNTLRKAKELQDYFINRLQPEDTVFDFSDSPTLFYTLLQLKPASRFIHVSMAIRTETQQLLIADLKRNQPKYVIYQSVGGLNGWDGIANDVRHNLVAAYIHRHYVFDQYVGTSLIFRRADIAGHDSVVNAPNQDMAYPPGLAECGLGYIPNLFIPPAQVKFFPAALGVNNRTLEINGWVAKINTDILPEIQILQNGLIIKKFTPNSVRPDIDKAYGRTLGLTGFLQKINYEDNDSKFDIQIVDQRTKKISKFGEDGWLGKIDSLKKWSQVSLDLGTGPSPHYLKLKFDHPHSNDDQPISIMAPGYPGGKVTFIKTAEANELVLPIGGCYVWSMIANRHPVILFSNDLNIQDVFSSKITEGGL